MLLLALAACLAAPAAAQTVRPPEIRQEYHRAERAWRTGTNLYEAKVRLDRVLGALPDDVRALLLRARVLLDLERPHEALADARAATALVPDDGHAWLVRAEAALRTDGACDEALDALGRAAERITDGIEEHVRLSWIAQALSDVDRAESFARIALALGPAEPAAYWRLAEVFAEQGRDDDATTLIVRGLTDGVLSGVALRAHPVLAPLAESPAIRPLLDG
jgi:tetratricopeptide (TPR) repeat protein